MMYEDLFKRNKEALEFLKEETKLPDEQLNSLWPIRSTALQSYTIVGIADMMTKFADKQNNDR